MRRRLLTLAGALGFAAAAGLGGLLGVAAGERVTEPGIDEFVVDDPAAYSAAHPAPLRSAGGFTGFGQEPALGGAVLRTGTVEPAEEDGAFTVVGDGHSAQVRHGQGSVLFAIEPLEAPAAGDLVIVRLEGDAPTGVLRVPADLGEGQGAGESFRERSEDAE